MNIYKDREKRGFLTLTSDETKIIKISQKERSLQYLPKRKEMETVTEIFFYYHFTLSSGEDISHFRKVILFVMTKPIISSLQHPNHLFGS